MTSKPEASDGMRALGNYDVWDPCLGLVPAREAQHFIGGLPSEVRERFGSLPLPGVTPSHAPLERRRSHHRGYDHHDDNRGEGGCVDDGPAADGER